MISFDTQPARYRHWRLEVDGRVATLVLDVDEDGGLKPGYKLKLNSYDLGVDIELNDALQRIRFEHPQVACVVLTSGKQRMFCSGANIYMLGASSHAWKVNFCKFTNETRNGMEESSRSTGLKFVAALNGTTAGGGYEVALACDEILMVDDRSTTISLPEVPLLGVLPGTGGLTRLIDKRKVRRDLADLFCTTAEGVRAERAKAWRLVDHVAPPARFADLVRERAAALAAASDRPAEAAGIPLPPLARTITDDAIRYPHLEVGLDRAARIATLTLSGPAAGEVTEIADILARGADWWPLALARELDDAILLLRLNAAEIGTFVLKTQGDADAVLAQDAALRAHDGHWLVRETLGLLRRTFSRLDVSSRSLIALVEPGSCFAGLLAELVLAADRSFMLESLDGGNDGASLALSPLNFAGLPMAHGLSRIANRFCGETAPVEAARAAAGRRLNPRESLDLGLVTFTPDDLDWADEVRIAIEERASLSPDALTALEANLRFTGPESMETRIFGRLSAWQNWVFNRPNAVGTQGALKVYGSGAKPSFDWERV